MSFSSPPSWCSSWWLPCWSGPWSAWSPPPATMPVPRMGCLLLGNVDVDGRARVQRRKALHGHAQAVGRHGAQRVRRQAQGRSEEHTSELQSHSDLVCRLLLEKKTGFSVCPPVPAS